MESSGWVREPFDNKLLTAAGQVFRMATYHANYSDANYQRATRVQVLDPSNVIPREPGQDTDDGSYLLRLVGYDLTPAGPSETKVTLSYDWSAVPELLPRHIRLPPFPADHEGNSLPSSLLRPAGVASPDATH